jgi:hypothetical protein
MNIKAIGTALKKKAGAPGEFLYDKLKKPHDDLKMKRADEKYAFVKDYQAKKKTGTAISNQDRAKYESMK